jgi:predicted secreted Zn-dependent protease
MKHLGGLLFSLLFAALALLAFNPYLVVRIQNEISFLWIDPPEKAPTNIPQTPIKLPDTQTPDAENLPRLPNTDLIAKNDPWIGDSPCRLDIFDAPETLRGVGQRLAGPLQTTPISAHENYIIQNQPTFLYKSQNGVTLKLVQPVFEYYEVSGRRYRHAQKDIFDRQPLKAVSQSKHVSPDTPSQNTGSRTATLAFIHSPTSLSYTLSGSRDRYRLLPRQTVLTSAFLITLPRWTSYDTARPADQAKWDDLFCNAAHHELGHLRIRLDILAETLDGYAALPPASSYDEMEMITIEYRTEISARVQTRQDAYHVYNDGGVRRGMIELPYAELPFPWLETSKEAPNPDN